MAERTDSEVFEQLRKADWGYLGKEMLRFARWRARVYGWYGDNLALGYTHEDIVQHIILKTIEGKRRWDPNKWPSLQNWLLDQVKSALDNLYKKSAGKMELPFIEGNDTSDDVVFLKSVATDDQPVPEAIVVEQEQATVLKAMVDVVFETVEDKPDLHEICEAIMNGCDPRPRYLAEELGVSVEEIYNRRKRLLRLASRLRMDNE